MNSVRLNNPSPTKVGSKFYMFLIIFSVKSNPEELQGHEVVPELSNEFCFILLYGCKDIWIT